MGKERATSGPPKIEPTDASAKDENLNKFFMTTSGIRAQVSDQ